MEKQKIIFSQSSFYFDVIAVFGIKKLKLNFGLTLVRLGR